MRYPLGKFDTVHLVLPEFGELRIEEKLYCQLDCYGSSGLWRGSWVRNRTHYAFPGLERGEKRVSAVLGCLFLSSFDNVPTCLSPHTSLNHDQ